MARPDGSLSLVHSVQIQNEDAGSWYSAKVDAHSGDMLNVVDYVNDLAVSNSKAELQRLLIFVCFAVHGHSHSEGRCDRRAGNTHRPRGFGFFAEWMG